MVRGHKIKVQIAYLSPSFCRNCSQKNYKLADLLGQAHLDGRTGLGWILITTIRFGHNRL